MTEDPIITEREGAVSLARLNRPQTHNALSPELMDQLAALVEEWGADPAVRCIVIAGGQEYFAAGADIRGMTGGGAQDALVHATARFWPRMGACRTPLVAAVSGYALGSGCELALLCDLVVASETAELGQPEIQLGMIPGGGATQRLTRVIGRQRAMELLLTGRRIGAEEAFRLGLVNRVAPKRKWLSQALELAQIVARRPPIAVQLAKQAVLAAEETGLEDGLARERHLHELAMATEDRVEGVQAFIEKRRPDFKGR
ncbi:MAG: enoyl-CoA hydratase/isomerase family protein [Thermoleophilaceae bacterium]|nr:enoyl-CoA hydratase/isomerase family protein [Thermoleophilaceae bacterium]